MDIRKKFRLNIFLNVLAATVLSIAGTALGILEPHYGIKITYFAVALIGVIMLLNKAMLQVAALDKISYNQGLTTFRNIMK